MDPEAYLARIRAVRPERTDAEALTALHLAHMRAVPFENLDIPLGRPIELTREAVYDKVVRRRRGGFCYELNALFAWLLEELGFDVQLLSARVYLRTGAGRERGDALGPEFDHMLSRVVTAGGRAWFCDVGFGDSFIEPLPVDGTERTQRGVRFRVTARGPTRTLECATSHADESEDSGGFERQYVFTEEPFAIEAFRGGCEFQQTSPESSFTRKTVCSRLTEAGRVTISNDRLIVTTVAAKSETPIESTQHLTVLLREHFGISLEAGADLDRLLRGRRA